MSFREDLAEKSHLSEDRSADVAFVAYEDLRNAKIFMKVGDSMMHGLRSGWAREEGISPRGLSFDKIDVGGSVPQKSR